MSRNLQLQVVLSALDKATGPIKAIMGSSAGLGAQLKQTRDQLKGLQSQQSNIQSFKALKAASEQSKQAMSEQQQKVKELAAGMRQAEVPTKAMTKEFQAATREAHRLKQNHSANSQQLQAMRGKLSEAGISTRNLSEAERGLRGRISETNKSLTDQQSRLKRVTDQQKRLSAAKAQYERTTQLASNMTTAGAGGIGVAYGVKSMADRFLAPGIAYGAQMSELQAVSRLSKDDERFKGLKNQARELGATTAFSASEVGAGQTFLARAGFTPESIRSSMRDVLELALANGTDLARTADIASNISGAFKIDPEVEGNMRRVADVLSGVSARANVNLEMLGDTMKYLGKAEGLNMSLEQTAAMAGVLGNIGIQSSQAGTTMRAMLDRITAPAKSGAEAMKALGLQVKDASGNMRNMPDIISDVAKATAKMGNVDQAKYLKDIFGAEAGSGMAELIAQQGTGALSKLIEELYSVQGENAQMAATRADNIDGDLKNLSSAWEEIGNSITDINEGPLRDLIQQITKVLRGVGAWATKNPELVATIAKVAVVIGIIAGAGGTLMLTIGSILGPLAMMKYGLTVLGIKGGVIIPIIKGIGTAMMFVGKALLANPIFLAIALLAGAAYLIYQNWEPIKAFFINLWGGISVFLSGIWDQITVAFSGGIGGISALILNWSPLGLFYQVFAGVMSYFGVDLPGKFSEFGGMIMQGLVTGIKNAAGAVKDAVVGMGDSVGGWFKDKLGIKSPSRVFMQFGGDTAEGLALGIAANKDSPLKQVAGMAKQVAAAGALTLASGMSFASDIQFDTRAPIASPSAGAQGQGGSVTNNYTINVTGGGDPKALADEVMRQIEAYDRAKQVRKRSTFGDLD